MVTCCAINCTSRSHRNCGKSFHRLPISDPVRLAEWMKNIRRDKWNPTKCSTICSDHFEEHHFDRTGQTIRLRDSAIPTIFRFPEPTQKVKTRGKLLKKKPDSYPDNGADVTTEMETETGMEQMEGNPVLPELSTNTEKGKIADIEMVIVQLIEGVSPDLSLGSKEQQNNQDPLSEVRNLSEVPSSENKKTPLMLQPHGSPVLMDHCYLYTPLSLTKKLFNEQYRHKKTKKKLRHAQQKIRRLNRKVHRLNELLNRLKDKERASVLLSTKKQVPPIENKINTEILPHSPIHYCMFLQQNTSEQSELGILVNNDEPIFQAC